MAKTAQVGDNVKITLSNDDEIDATISYIANEENEKKLIVLELKTLTEDLIQYRKISFNITWWSYSGLRVPNSSILEDENGQKYVIKKKNEEQQKVIVKVLKKNDKYSIINTYNNEELEALNIDVQNYNKIEQYDTILLYPEN